MKREAEYNRGFQAGLRQYGGLYASGSQAYIQGFLDGVKAQKLKTQALSYANSQNC